MIYTVITGASKGLGLALAMECAKRKMNLILLALPGEGIKDTAESLKRDYKIDVCCYEADLTKTEEIDRVSTSINDNFRVNTLINNAGIGGTEKFETASLAYVEDIILLNIRATVLLSHRLLGNLMKNENSKILNIASLASFGPIPLKTVYPASKAFIYSFSRGLSMELKSSGILVSVAHPGGMATNELLKERIEKYNRLVQSTILTPEKTAKICIRRFLKDDRLIIPGFMNKVSWLIFQIIPVWLRLPIFHQSLKRELPENTLCYES